MEFEIPKMETKVCCALLDVHRVCRLWLMDFFNARFVEMEDDRERSKQP